MNYLRVGLRKILPNPEETLFAGSHQKEAALREQILQI